MSPPDAHVKVVGLRIKSPPFIILTAGEAHRGDAVLEISCTYNNGLKKKYLVHVIIICHPVSSAFSR